MDNSCSARGRVASSISGANPGLSYSPGDLSVRGCPGRMRIGPCFPELRGARSQTARDQPVESGRTLARGGRQGSFGFVRKARLVPTVGGAVSGVLTRCAPWVLCNLILSKAAALLAGRQENQAAIACNVYMRSPNVVACKAQRICLPHPAQTDPCSAAGVGQLRSGPRL